MSTTGYITTQGGTRIYYKDWASGQPVVFSHGWPHSADAALLHAKLVKGATLNVYKGAPHDLCATH